MNTEMNSDDLHALNEDLDLEESNNSENTAFQTTQIRVSTEE
jgi:hypothetical protein